MVTSSSSSKPSEQINLLRGSPNPSLLPANLIKSAAAIALSDSNIYVPGLEYGPEQGYQPLRQSVARWLTQFYQPSKPVTENRICITGGASQNLGCLLNVYTDPEYTRNIWIVAPAYFLAFRIFEDAGFGVDGKMRAVPEDGEGLDIDFLCHEIEKSEQGAKKRGEDDKPRFKPLRTRAKVYKHVIYCVPTFANPSSRTMSLHRRTALVKLARQYDALIVSDDVYDFLQWPADPKSAAYSDRDQEVSQTVLLPRLVDIDRELHGEAEDSFGNVCSNGSFSKIAGPGIRVGWAESTEKFAYGVSQAGTTTSGGAPSQLTSTYINQLLESGSLQNHIRTVLIPAYTSRYKTLMQAVQTHLIPLGFILPQTDREVIGGYFTWLTLPTALKASAKTLAKRCIEDANVIIAAGNIFEVPGDNEGDLTKFDRNVRFCWAAEEEDKLDEGVKRVGGVVRNLLDEDADDEGGEYVVVESVVDGFK